MVDSAVEVLRAENRPMNIRQLVDQLMKRKWVDGRGGQQEVAKRVQVALLGHEREREVEGRRPKIRSLGAGQFVFSGRKLDQEILQAERDLRDRADRLREATRVALIRKLRRLSAPSFESLCLLVCERLAIFNLELLRRGEGVAYFGGERKVGLSNFKTLIGVRAGDVEFGRRAVGELRAGLPAKGYDEGILLAAGRPGADAAAEIKISPTLDIYGGHELAALCIRLAVGVRQVRMSVDQLDVELFACLGEGGE